MDCRWICPNSLDSREDFVNIESVQAQPFAVARVYHHLPHWQALLVQDVRLRQTLGDLVPLCKAAGIAINDAFIWLDLRLLDRPG